MGRSAERLFQEDQNAFMVEFRRTDDEELITGISIRMSMIEFLDECIFDRNFDLSLAQQVL